jgi:hypothetical protein
MVSNFISDVFLLWVAMILGGAISRPRLNVDPCFAIAKPTDIQSSTRAYRYDKCTPCLDR